jgi:hypothetical protein
MKIAFSFIAACLLQFCFAQVDYTEITDYQKLKSLQAEINSYSFELSCDSAHMLGTVNDTIFRAKCADGGGFYHFSSGNGALSNPESFSLMRSVLVAEFGGEIEFESITLSSNVEQTLLYIEYYPEPKSLPRPKAFLFKRNNQDNE